MINISSVQTNSKQIKFFRAGGLIFVCLLVCFNACAGKTKTDDETRLPVSIDSSPAIGNPKAPVTIVEFTDFECPFCGRVQGALKQIRAIYPDQVRLVFKNFPLKFHRHALTAHLAALCADDQGKFWEYRNLLFENQKALKKDDLLKYAENVGLSIDTFENCLKHETHADKIDDDIEEAGNLGVQGTPAFLINGRAFAGAMPFSDFQQIIEEELSKAKSQSPIAGQT